MRDFIGGWKRKSGLATLLMACMLTAGWVRSYSVCDHFGEPVGFGVTPTVLNLTSGNGRIVISVYRDLDYFDPSEWAFPNWCIIENHNLGKNQNWIEFWDWEDYAHRRKLGCEASHSLIVIPLTLLSAYLLLLSKPRPARNRTADTSITRKGSDTR